MRRTRKSYLLVLATAVVALLLSTWGTGVSLAQEHDHDDMEHDAGHDMDHSGDPGGGAEECSFLRQLFGLCARPGGDSQDRECGFLDRLLRRCDTGGGGRPGGGGGTDLCSTYSLLEWLRHHECHGHSFL